MKIGFYSHNYNTLGKYWEKLKDRVDCWWGVPEKALYDVLKDKGAENISYRLEKYVKNIIPLGREQTPEDIGNAVTFLASDAASNITGQALNVSGGSHIN